MGEIVNIKNFYSYFRVDHQYILALRNINMKFFPNEIIGIVGESGSGKSVLAKAIIGLYKSNQICRGQIIYKRVDGHYLSINELDSDDIKMLRRNEIFYLPQNSLNVLDPLYDIKSEVLSRINLARGKKKTDDESLKRILEAMAIEEKLGKNEYFKNFSGGQKQKTLLAQMLLLKPRLAILDEPTTAIDRSGGDDIIEEIMKIKKENEHITIIVITHDISLVSKVSDRLYVMYGGEILEEGRTNDVLLNACHPYTNLLINTIPDIERPLRLNPIENAFDNSVDDIFELITKDTSYNRCSFISRCVQGNNCSGKSKPELNRLADEHYYRCYFPKKSYTLSSKIWEDGQNDEENEIILNIKNLTVSADDYKKPLIRNINLSVYQYDRVGIVGPSGCGKTTLFKSVLFLDHDLEINKDSEIIFLDHQLSRVNIAQFRDRIQYVPQVYEDTFLPQTSVIEAMAEPLFRNSRRTFVPDIIKENKHGLRQLLHDLSLDELENRSVNELSGGQKQRVAIGRALVALNLHMEISDRDPLLLLLDEPTSSLDVTLQSSILYYIEQLQRKYALSLIIISHNIPLIYNLCNHFYVISKEKGSNSNDSHKNPNPGFIVNHITEILKTEISINKKMIDKLHPHTQELIKE